MVRGATSPMHHRLRDQHNDAPNTKNCLFATACYYILSCTHIAQRFFFSGRCGHEARQTHIVMSNPSVHNHTPWTASMVPYKLNHRSTQGHYRRLHSHAAHTVRWAMLSIICLFVVSSYECAYSLATNERNRNARKTHLTTTR